MLEKRRLERTSKNQIGRYNISIAILWGGCPKVGMGIPMTPNFKTETARLAYNLYPHSHIIQPAFKISEKCEKIGVWWVLI